MMVVVAPTAKPTEGLEEASTLKEPTLFATIRLLDDESCNCRRLPLYLFKMPEPRTVKTLAAVDVASRVVKSAESAGAVVVPARIVGA